MIKSAKLAMIGMPSHDATKVMCRDKVELDDGLRSMKLKLLGDAVYDQEHGRFRE